MGSDTSRPGSARGRWAWVLVVLVVVVAAVGTTAWWMWPRRPDRDPMRLGLLKEAIEEYNAGRYQNVDAILARRAADRATTSSDWMLRARMAETRGRLDDALGYLEHIRDTDPIAPQAWMRAGQIERARNRLRAAEAAFRHALALSPDQVQSHRELAYVYVLQRRKDEGNAEFRELARLTAVDYKMAFAWTQNDCDLFDPKEAKRLLIPIVATDPDDRWSRLALAGNYRATLQLDLAEATLDPLGDSDPDARALRVQIALDRGEPEVADRLLQGGPTDHARLNDFRGRLALRAGDLARAVDLFRAALRREPRDRDAIHGLGMTLQRLGDPGAGEYLRILGFQDELKRIIIESGNTGKIDLKLLLKLAGLCESLGRTDQAGVWYQVALAMEPLDIHAQQGLARLRRQAVESDAGSGPCPDPRH